MAYPVNIVINNRNWYDSRIIESDPVVFQNVNYATGDDRSVNVVRQRFMQDWARQIIPNSIRKGVGLTDPAGGSDEIIVTQGYAVIAGRFLEIPAGTFDASLEGLTSSKWYYLAIEVTDFTEGDTRKSSDGSAFLVGIPLTGPTYTKSHNHLVIAKFYYDGVDIDQFEDYTAIQEWQANILSPVAAIPGLSTGSDNILLRAGFVERVDNLGIETDTTRFYLNAVFNDQDSTPVEEVKLTNFDAVLQVSDLTNADFLGMDMLELATGSTVAGLATTRIDSSGNLVNIADINGRTMGGNASTDLIDTDTAQTMTNKTLTSPIQTGGTLNAGAALTVDSTELNQLDTVDVGGNTSGDIITTDDTQTMTSKTLTTPVISTLYQTGPSSNLQTFPNSPQTLVGLTSGDTLSNKILRTLVIQDSDQSNTGEIRLPNLSGDKFYDITQPVDDIFVFEGLVQNITGAKTFTADNLLNVAPTYWSDAIHAHDATNTGSILSINNATTGTLAVGQGGTGISSHASTRLLVGQTGGGLSAVPMSVGATMTQAGVVTIDGAQHTHNTQYYTETEMNALLHIGSGNKGWVHMIYEGNDDNLTDVVYNSGEVANTIDSGFTYHTYTLPIPLTQGGYDLYITQCKFYINDGDTNNKIASVRENNWKAASGSNQTVISSAGWYTIGEHNVTGINRNMSTTDRWIINLQIQNNNIGSFGLGYFLVEYYYV